MNNSNKKKLFLLVLTLIMCLGVSYAAIYFAYLGEDTRENMIETGLISINYQEGSNVINLDNTVPMIDDLGLENDPYLFTVKNTSKIPIKLKFEVIPGNNSQIPVSAIRYGLYINDEFVKKGHLNKDNNEIYLIESFSSNQTINAKLVFWVDYYYENPGKTFSASVKVTGESFDIIYEEVATDVLKKKLGTGGLVAVNTDGDLYDGTGTVREYRYSGPTVDNYAYFNCKDTNGIYNYGDANYDYENNCEVWRIIGIFDDNGQEKVKLVRNTFLTAEELPESYLIDGTTYTIANGTMSSDSYWNYVLSGTYPSIQKTDWTKSGLQYFLNTESDETTNVGYLSYLTENAKEQTATTTYYLGNVYYEVETVKKAYNQERGSVECASSITSSTHNNNCNIWSGNKASWDGLIGLMYPSDYGYSASNIYWETDMYGWDSAESDGVKARSTSWLYQTANHQNTNEWFLSPSASYTSYVVNWEWSGEITNHVVDYIDYGVRPVLNLKSENKIIMGDGTKDNPYVFKI